MIRICLDDLPKTVIRVYDWGNKIVKFKLCDEHAQKPQFSNFISETKINEVLQN